MSHVVIRLNKWFGIDELVSLVDIHQSNGVEPANKSILRHLRALTFDFRISINWSAQMSNERKIATYIQQKISNLEEAEVLQLIYEW